MVEHLEHLLKDDRLIVDTTAGRRPAVRFNPVVARNDRAADLKRIMTEMNRPDRDLQSKMPVGEMVEATLSTTKMMFLKKDVGKIRMVCVSPTRQLIAGDSPAPLTLADTRKVISEATGTTDVPLTLVVVSTSGFEINAHEAAQRTADRAVVLVEPNDVGGWNCYGPVETKSLVDLFDPEQEQAKRQRIVELIQASQIDLSQGGIAADFIAGRTQLPLGLIETEVKSYAKSHAGLAAKRLDGRIVLFREGTMPAPATAPGGSDMPLIDRIKALFSRKGETEKKIAFLSERRTSLMQQRDRAYEEITSLEQKDTDLRNQFRQSESAVTRRRVTSHLVQLRNDLERRQQMISVLNQQINVVGTHLHNLELTRQGQVAKLPDGEEIATDAAAAEEMLAELQATSELAESVSATTVSSMSDEEMKLYEELERQAGGPTTTKVDLDKVEVTPAEPPRRAAPQSDTKPAEPEAG